VKELLNVQLSPPLLLPPQHASSDMAPFCTLTFHSHDSLLRGYGPSVKLLYPLTGYTKTFCLLDSVSISSMTASYKMRYDSREASTITGKGGHPPMPRKGFRPVVPMYG